MAYPGKWKQGPKPAVPWWFDFDSSTLVTIGSERPWLILVGFPRSTFETMHVCLGQYGFGFGVGTSTSTFVSVVKGARKRGTSIGGSSFKKTHYKCKQKIDMIEAAFFGVFK